METFLRGLEECLVFIEARPRLILPYEELHDFLKETFINQNIQPKTGRYIIEHQTDEGDNIFIVKTKPYSKKILGMQLIYRTDFTQYSGQYKKICLESGNIEFNFIKRFY